MSDQDNSPRTEAPQKEANDEPPCALQCDECQRAPCETQEFKKGTGFLDSFDEDEFYQDNEDLVEEARVVLGLPHLPVSSMDRKPNRVLVERLESPHSQKKASLEIIVDQADSEMGGPFSGTFKDSAAVTSSQGQSEFQRAQTPALFSHRRAYMSYSVANRNTVYGNLRQSLHSSLITLKKNISVQPPIPQKPTKRDLIELKLNKQGSSDSWSLMDSISAGSFPTHTSSFHRSLKRKQRGPIVSNQNKMFKETMKKRKKKTWTDSSMLSHILTYIFLLFVFFSTSFIGLFEVSLGLYSERINQEISRVMISESKTYIGDVLKSMASQQDTFRATQKDLLEGQAAMLDQLEFGFPVGGELIEGAHILEWQVSKKVSTVAEAEKTIDDYSMFGQDLRSNDEFLKLLGFVYHSSTLSDKQEQVSRQIKALNDFWVNTIQQNYTYNTYDTNSTLEIKQIYLQVEFDDDIEIYSFPAVLSDKDQNLRYRLRLEPIVIADIYQRCKDKKETIFDYGTYDIAQSRYRRATIAHPLLSPDGSFRGALIWEYDLGRAFTKVLLPQSYFEKKIPFIQYRLPEHPNLEYMQEAVENNETLTVNMEYRDEAPDEMEKYAQIVPKSSFWFGGKRRRLARNEPVLIIGPPSGTKSNETIAPDAAEDASYNRSFGSNSSYVNGTDYETPEAAMIINDPDKPAVVLPPVSWYYEADQPIEFQDERFDLVYPLGQIVFQKNTNAGLNNLGISQEYIRFVNLAQEMVFNGTLKKTELLTQDIKLFQWSNATYSYQSHAYRLFAKSLRSEREIWRDPKTGEEDYSQFSNARTQSQSNMIMILAQDVESSEQVLLNGTYRFVRLSVTKFKYNIMGMVAVLSLSMLIVILSLIKSLIVSPIMELTRQILNPPSHKSMSKFLSKIRASQQRKEQIEFKRRMRTEKHGKQPGEEIQQINEVEELRFIFSKFFKQSSSLTSKLQIQQVRERGYTLLKKQDDEIQPMKAEVAVKKILRFKYVFLVPEEESLNHLNFESQLEFANNTEQLQMNFERLMIQEIKAQGGLPSDQHEFVLMPPRPVSSRNRNHDLKLSISNFNIFDFKKESLATIEELVTEREEKANLASPTYLVMGSKTKRAFPESASSGPGTGRTHRRLQKPAPVPALQFTKINEILENSMFDSQDYTGKKLLSPEEDIDDESDQVINQGVHGETWRRQVTKPKAVLSDDEMDEEEIILSSERSELKKMPHEHGASQQLTNNLRASSNVPTGKLQLMSVIDNFDSQIKQLQTEEAG